MADVLYPPSPNSQKLELARHYLKMMIFAVETRPNGFDYGGVMALVENWLMLGKNFRGSGYPNDVQHMWIRRYTPKSPTNGKKRTQALVESLKQLNHFLNPGEANLEGLYSIFTDVQTQMFDLVADFRNQMEKMNHKDLARFVNALQRVTAQAKARMQ